MNHVAELVKNRSTAITAGVLFGLLSSRWLNTWLSYRALNNSVKDRTWDWKKEIVLLTGGSSGIGAVTAAKLAEKGVKVIIVDLHPPKAKLGTTSFHRF